ncbi:hypothetical protein MNBD_DELTA02-492 [hydrothermal vent metagenome]|uniref:Ribbon-helix-helix protein CopG domain-containing protein n=1 Tax=hydrothermal vent metagenome TaxID=652676 RepID=A0A3B0V0K5_9ZZZZ
MEKKRTMTLNLSKVEMEVLEALCHKKGLSKTALIRQALRLYQSVEVRLEKGEKLFIEDPIKKEKSELIVI